MTIGPRFVGTWRFDKNFLAYVGIREEGDRQRCSLLKWEKVCRKTNWIV